MDELDFIIKVEQDGFDHENDQEVEALQKMIDSGLAFRLQGFWGRFATQMINMGIVNPPKAA
jgi:hypothetical protein